MKMQAVSVVEAKPFSVDPILIERPFRPTDVEDIFDMQRSPSSIAPPPPLDRSA